MLWLRGNHTANYRGCVKWKETKAALAKQAPEQGHNSIATGQTAAPKAQGAGPCAKQRDLGEGWNHIVGGGVMSKLPPHQHLIQIPLHNWSRRRLSSL